MNVYELQAKIGLDASGYYSGIKNAKLAFGQFTNFTSSAVRTVVKAGVTAVAAGTAALTALGKLSLDRYAEFEQLSGGIEKIFDQMDNTKIFQDADNAWKDLNMSANDYLTTIIDVGANFASTMGDKKGYDTARKGFLAISNYASGTGKNIDNLSEKFTMITRSASSYQSIADQFSGILPATSKDFLKQAQAAGFLSKKYKDLTKVPIAEYQEAVALMLEKGVATLNLTGNTAKETATTISGSIAAVKSTWENLVTAFADPEKDLGTYVDRFVESVVTAKDRIVPRIKEMLPRIIDGLGQLIDELGPEVEEIINELLPHLIKGAAKLVAELIVRLPGLLATFAVELKDALVQALDEAGYGDIADKLESAFNWIIENKDSIISTLTAIGGVLATVFVASKIAGFISAISGLFSPLGLLLTFVVAVAAGMIENWERVKWSWNTMLEQFEILGDGFAEICEDIKEWFDGVKQKISDEIDSIKESFEQFKQGLSDMRDGFAEIIADIKQKFIDIKDRISQEIDSIKESFGKFKQGLSDLKQGFEDIKADVSTKFTDIKNSISESLQAAIDNVSGKLDDIKKKFSDAFDKVKSTVKSAIDTIKGYFNFSWSLPHIKLPHFSVSGSFSLNPPRVPSFSVSWYKKAMDNAMILNGATIFGYMGGKFLGGGEAGQEIVAGSDTLMKMIKNAVREGNMQPVFAASGNTSGITIIQNIQSVPQTAVEFASTTESYFEQARWAF